MPSFFENQSIASGILTHPSHKKAESNLLADAMGPQQKDPGSLVIHEYL